MRLIPELLAPAGDWESMVAAVANGADAVYLGGKLFSARASAGNFDRQDIKRAVEYAHIRGAKVYVTVNTLIADDELSGAIKFLHYLQQVAVDAVIVQDLGLIRLSRQVLPELPLYASTQMTVNNSEAALLLRDYGLQRMVLAREMSLEEIKEVIRLSGVETEVFVHGALCFCYSGQCLLSSLIGGRSGNRGRCAQPCRLPYTLVNEDGRMLADPKSIGKHLLSPRDLNLSNYISDLCQAGITSLKIEGRMKRPEYVATVVRVYRALLDRVAADDGGGYQVLEEESRDLTQIFNRDFTPGYIFQNPGRDLMSYKRPNNRGLFLGRIKSFNKNLHMAEILLEQPLRKGDGIEVWITDRGRAAGTVGRIIRGKSQVEYAKAGETVLLDMPGRVFSGDRVFKTNDSVLIRRAVKTFTEGKEHKKVPLVFEATALLDKPLSLRITDPSGNVAESTASIPGKPAIDRPITEKFIKKQLLRLGSTPYSLSEFYCQLAESIMIPVSEINEARRQAVAVMTDRRKESAIQVKPVTTDEFQQRWSSVAQSTKTV
ncbi:MAG: U32 family peptidase, partial [Peptococcaceae bacterium]|nr:U32 family peptidase [Peptococcaceae bacterium]